MHVIQYHIYRSQGIQHAGLIYKEMIIMYAVEYYYNCINVTVSTYYYNIHNSITCWWLSWENYCIIISIKITVFNKPDVLREAFYYI